MPGLSFDARATLAIVGGTAALLLWGPIRRSFAERPSPEECEEVAGRWAEATARALDAEVSAGELARVRAAALASDRPRRCVEELTRGEVRCALAAGNVDEMERCLE